VSELRTNRLAARTGERSLPLSLLNAAGIVSPGWQIYVLCRTARAFPVCAPSMRVISRSGRSTFARHDARVPRYFTRGAPGRGARDVLKEERGGGWVGGENPSEASLIFLPSCFRFIREARSGIQRPDNLPPPPPHLSLSLSLSLSLFIFLFSFSVFNSNVLEYSYDNHGRA